VTVYSGSDFLVRFSHTYVLQINANAKKVKKPQRNYPLVPTLDERDEKKKKTSPTTSKKQPNLALVYEKCLLFG